jgi:2-hydroxychromene-2-carboxylate isomerase
VRGRAVFYYDLASPEAYLAAERITTLFGGSVEWQPVLLEALPRAGTLDAFRCAQERDIYMADVERRASQLGLQPVRWPAAWPPDSTLAMRAATYAKQIGRAIAFSLAAFRQAFAAGRDLGGPDGVVIAAAACEIHPAALLKAVETRAVVDELDRATAAAASLGVTGIPALALGDELFEGATAVDEAAAVAAGA